MALYLEPTCSLLSHHKTLRGHLVGKAIKKSALAVSLASKTTTREFQYNYRRPKPDRSFPRSPLRIRKVKCDEARPHCLRCVRTGRKCDGYRTSPNSSPEPLISSPSLIPGFETPHELHSYDFYRARSARALSGHVDAGFWGGLVLKLSVTEPAVRHAMLAISSLHECVEVKSNYGRELDKGFAFREYGKAIRSLRHWAQRDEPSALPLLVCILFICIEFLAHHDAAAQMHICQGRKILTGLKDGHSPSMEMVKRSLVPIYARLSLASFLFGSQPEIIPPHLKGWADVPAVFASVDDARCGLYLIIDEALQFTAKGRALAFNPNSAPETVQALYFEQQKLLSQVVRWNAAFTVLTSMSAQSAVVETSLNILRIYHQASQIWISTALQPYECAYDAHLPAFASIISLASTIIGSVPNSVKTEAFCFETELIAPIYWTATKCRHPLLRRAALKLLTRDQMRNRRENLWHVRETTVIAARIIEMEESGHRHPPRPLHPTHNVAMSDNDSEELEDKWTCPPSKIKIETTSVPSLPPPPPSFTDSAPEDNTPTSDNFNSGSSSISSSSNHSEPISPISSAMEAIQQLDLGTLQTANLESPFGIPENRRVKNATIGPSEEGGIWSTFFRDPEPGETKWKIDREFFRLY